MPDARKPRTAGGRPTGTARSATRPAAAATRRIAAGAGAAPSRGRQHPGTAAKKTAAPVRSGKGAQAAAAGGRLRSELLVPIGLGMLVEVAAVGLLAVAGGHLAASWLLAIAAAGVGLTAGLLWWGAMLIEGAAARPLEHVRGALQQMEEGDYAARLAPAGASELREVAAGFNRMATIVEHQRERLKKLAATDALTGLANHRHFHERLRGEMQAAQEAGQPLAVVALDIDGFKQVNEARGHARGDETLRAAAEALLKAVRDEDLVARAGGDDFMLILRAADSGYTRDATERIRAALARALPDDPVLTASAGYVCLPDQVSEESSPAELAAAALEVAKRAGGDQSRKYDPEQVAAIPTVRQQRAEIDSLLARENPITPVFQPLVDLASGRIVGYEALSRFNTEVQRPPDAWFNQAHGCGRGMQLESTAIRAALAAPHRPQGLYLSLNFSPSVIGSSQMLTVLPSKLTHVVIEITEHELAGGGTALETGLTRLRERGARIAVDDVGAGYAGLNQIMRVQPDIIKLDRSLIAGVDVDTNKAALIEFFVMFARRVGARVCTEGIETVDELRALINLGVGYGQGYLLGRPGPPWGEISAEIARALATGALRTHAAAPARPVAAAPTIVPAAPVEAAGGPMNRRLYRYNRIDADRPPVVRGDL